MVREMKTTHEWVHPSYRTIPDYPSYVMNPNQQVWSLSRQVNCRGGATRTVAAKQLQLDNGRVKLSVNNITRRFNVANELFPLTWPELVRERQSHCRNGHLISRPPHHPLFWDLVRVHYWGCGNRVCAWCSGEPPHGDSGYSRIYGAAGMPDYYSDQPTTPRIKYPLPELLNEHTCVVSDRPFRGRNWEDHGETSLHAKEIILNESTR